MAGIISESEVEVRHEVLNIKPSVVVESFNEILNRNKIELEQMAEEAPDHLIYSAAAMERLATFIQSAPPKTVIASNVTCAGVGLWLTTNVLYEAQRYIGATLPPGGVPVYRYSDGTKETVLVLDRYGRAGGPFGWDKYRDVVGYVLASFWHNFVISLIGYASRPKLPFSGKWVLPNIVLAETVAPRQAIPPASFTFTLLRPSFRQTFVITYSSNTPVTLGFEVWDQARNDVARVESYRIEETGDVRVIVNTRGRLLRTGYFTIDVHDAPNGIVVKEVYTRPVSISL